jgi:hypothetical protein
VEEKRNGRALAAQTAFSTPDYPNKKLIKALGELKFSKWLADSFLLAFDRPLSEKVCFQGRRGKSLEPR